MSDVTDKRPLYAHCDDCGYEWVWFFTPIPVSKLKYFKGCHCPYCYSKKTFTGKRRINNGYKVVER